jgi:hypothetical protein
MRNVTRIPHQDDPDRGAIGRRLADELAYLYGVGLLIFGIAAFEFGRMAERRAASA